jgi:hypothetical protein
MSGYKAPHLRKKEPKKDEPINLDENNFPFLTTNSHVSIKHLPVSYSEKAAEWKKQRLEIEHNERVENEMKIDRKEQEVKKKEEEDYLISQSPFLKRSSKIEEIKKETIKKEVVTDEWTTVQKKVRKERKDCVDFTEQPEELVADEDDHSDSLWD